jgi:biotin carboxyl carrier protein
MHGKLELNDDCFEVEAHQRGKKISITLDGTEWLVELEATEEGYIARLGGNAIQLDVTAEQKDQLCLSKHTDIAVDGHLFGVQFHPQRKHQNTQSAFEGAQDEGSVTALMPGTIFKLLVEEGQEVQAGDVLLILEAMKMENEIKAPLSGTVEAIAVTEGKSVNKGELLVQLACD